MKHYMNIKYTETTSILLDILFRCLNAADAMLLSMMQEKVACLLDNDAHLALDPLNRYKIQVICLNTFLSHLFSYFFAEF